MPGQWHLTRRRAGRHGHRGQGSRAERGRGRAGGCQPRPGGRERRRSEGWRWSGGRERRSAGGRRRGADGGRGGRLWHEDDGLRRRRLVGLGEGPWIDRRDPHRQAGRRHGRGCRPQRRLWRGPEGCRRGRFGRRGSGHRCLIGDDDRGGRQLGHEGCRRLRLQAGGQIRQRVRWGALLGRLERCRGCQGPVGRLRHVSDRRVPAQIERGLKLVVQAGRSHVESPSGDIQPGFRVRHRGERSVHRWRRLLEGRGLLHRGLLHRWRRLRTARGGSSTEGSSSGGAGSGSTGSGERLVRPITTRTGAHPPGRVHRGLAVDKAGQAADIVNLGRVARPARLVRGVRGVRGTPPRLGSVRAGNAPGPPPRTRRRATGRAPRWVSKAGPVRPPESTRPATPLAARCPRQGARPARRRRDPPGGSAGRATQPDRVMSVVTAVPPAAVSDPPVVVASDPPRTRSSVGQALVSAASRGPSPGRVAHADPRASGSAGATPGGLATGRQERQWPSCSFQQAWQL